MNYLASIIPTQRSVIDLTTPIIVIPFLDFALCKIFSTKSRWFQLHSVINGIIVYIIYDDIINIIRTIFISHAKI